MADVVQFFLKVAEAGSDDLAPPYLLSFGLDRSDVAQAAETVQPILEAIRASAQFDDDTKAAQHALAEAILFDGHLDPEVQHVMAPVVVFLASDTPEKKAVIAAGARKVGFVLVPGKKAPELDFRFVSAPAA